MKKTRFEVTCFDVRLSQLDVVPVQIMDMTQAGAILLLAGFYRPHIDDMAVREPRLVQLRPPGIRPRKYRAEPAIPGDWQVGGSWCIVDSRDAVATPSKRTSCEIAWSLCLGDGRVVYDRRVIRANQKDQRKIVESVFGTTARALVDGRYMERIQKGAPRYMRALANVLRNLPEERWESAFKLCTASRLYT